MSLFVFKIEYTCATKQHTWYLYCDKQADKLNYLNVNIRYK